MPSGRLSVGGAGARGALLLLVLCLAGTPALAQMDEARASQDAPAAAPADGAAIHELPLPAPSGGASAAKTTGTSGLEVGTLSAVTPDYAGTLEEGGGGFPIDMWRGTDRGLIERVLPQLAPAEASPAMRDLQRRLLLTNAEAPAGKSGGVNLFTARAERLAAMGLAKDAAALLAMMPARMADKAAAQLRIDSLLLAGDVDGACKAVDDTRQAASADAAWQQAQVFCQLCAGQKDEAALGLDLLRDQGTKDPAFFQLADALGGRQTKLESLPDPTPLDLAMLRAADLPLPQDAAQSRNPGVLAAIAEDPSLSPGARLAAAERAAAGGGLSVEQLRKAYASLAFSPGDLANPIGASSNDQGPGGRCFTRRPAPRLSRRRGPGCCRRPSIAPGIGAAICWRSG